MTDPTAPGDVGLRRGLLLGGGLAVAAGLLLTAPAVLGVNVIPPCPFRTLTGFDCPLCGGTRATRALLTGDVSAAVNYNVLVPVMAVVGVILGLWWLAARSSGSVSFDGVRSALGAKAVWVGVVVLVAVFWLARNLPAFVFLNSGGPGT
jgi:hypothetical protein